MLRLLKQMKAKQWIMALLCVALILGQIYFDLRLPDYMSDLTVQIKTPGSTVSDVLHTGLEMLACTLISAVMAILCGYLNAQVAAGFSYHIRESVFQKVADFGQKEMLEFSVPSLINRTTNDITQIQMFVAMGMQTMIKAPVMAVWAVIKIVNKSWTLSVITAGFVVALLALMLIVVLVILPRVRRVQKLTDNINLISRENLTGISVVHAYNAEEYQEDKFEKANDVLMRTQLFNQRAMALLMPAVGLAMNALSLTIYWVGAAIVNRVPAVDLTGRISTFGDIVVFGTYATYIIMSLMMLVMILVLLPMAQVSAVRINEVLDETVDITDGPSDAVVEDGSVDFEDVCFSYSGDPDKLALRHITVHINSGETIGIIGGTGEGKSTLVNLIPRFYDTLSGTVRVGGRDVRDYTLEHLRDGVSMVLQNGALFSGTIAQNLRWGNANATQEQLREACAIACADEFIDRFPDGYETVLEQNAANLSGGQKQRLRIARAIVKQPKILILDDSTSAVDMATDEHIRRALKTAMPGSTKIIIAQRIASILSCDRIIVLHEGELSDVGTHAELMERSQIYRDVYDSQMREEGEQHGQS